MRCSAKTIKLLLCMLLGTFGATGATAGSFNTPLEHVIIVIQENRTPDNLFGADQALINAGARVDLAGSCHGKDIPLTAWQLDACFNPDHSHNPAWLDQYDGGAMDGSCSNQVTLAHCNKAQLPLCPKGNHQKYCPAYTYVSNADGLLDPYFEIAAQYGFANYMFQTNQGPSFPAHQFLFSGTSAPVGYPNQYFDWFAAENAGRSVGNYGYWICESTGRRNGPFYRPRSAGLQASLPSAGGYFRLSLLRAWHTDGRPGFGWSQLAVLQR
jgi:phospholipase C